jgi:hypothetical protein
MPFQHPLPIKSVAYSLKTFCLLSTCIVLTLFSGCDNSGVTTRESPQYVIRPSQEVTFPILVVGREITKEVEIENIGGVDLIIARSIIQTNISQSGEFKIEYKLPNNEAYQEISFEEGPEGSTADLTYPVRVGPNELLSINITYKPQDEEADSAAIYFDTNFSDPNAPERSRIDIPIRVSAGAAQIAVDPTSVDFDVVPASQERVVDLRVLNVGQSVLFIEQLRIDGSQDFTPFIDGRDPRRQPELLEDPDQDGIPGISPYIEGEGGGTLNMQLRYLPESAGPDFAEMVIVSNAEGQETYTVPLTANSRNPCLEVLPEAIEFPASLVSRTDSQVALMESCGGAELNISEIYITDDEEGVFALEGEQSLPLIMAAASSQGLRPSEELTLSFSPREEKIYNATLVIVSDDPVMPERRVSILGRGTANICPQARSVQDEFYVLPLDTIVLDGTPSVDQDGPNNLPVGYEWVITSRPQGSVSQLVERFDNPQQPADGGRPDDETTPTALFFIDLPGYYTAELRVTDQFGLTSLDCRNPSIVTILAEPDEAIQVQLSWEAANEDDLSQDRSGDLDLHLKHPNAGSWFSQPYDCFFNNPDPDWGQLDNPRDNPFLDLDDFSGTGPENLTLAIPEDTTLLGGEYVVGVDYYENIDRIDGWEYGPIKAYIRIFINGVPTWDYTEGGDPGFKLMNGRKHFWEVASISWPDGIVTKIDRYYEETPQP